MKPKLIVQIPNLTATEGQQFIDDLGRTFPDTEIAVLDASLKVQWGTPYAATFSGDFQDNEGRAAATMSVGCQTMSELAELLDLMQATVKEFVG